MCDFWPCESWYHLLTNAYHSLRWSCSYRDLFRNRIIKNVFSFKSVFHNRLRAFRTRTHMIWSRISIRIFLSWSDTGMNTISGITPLHFGHIRFVNVSEIVSSFWSAVVLRLFLRDHQAYFKRLTSVLWVCKGKIWDKSPPLHRERDKLKEEEFHDETRGGREYKSKSKPISSCLLGRHWSDVNDIEFNVVGYLCEFSISDGLYCLMIISYVLMMIQRKRALIIFNVGLTDPDLSGVQLDHQCE